MCHDINLLSHLSRKTVLLRHVYKKGYGLQNMIMAFLFYHQKNLFYQFGRFGSTIKFES